MGIKINQLPETDKFKTLQPRYPVDVWTVPSKHDPGVTHVILRFADNTYICTCRGWCYQQKCWHVDTAMESTDGT